MSRKTIWIGLAVLGLILVGAQFVQPQRINPPADPAASFEAVVKPAAQVSSALSRACRDCHSNETTWPWYSRIAPASWLVAADVKEGRGRLNLSEWRLLSPEMSSLRLKEMCAEVKEGEMPLWQYGLLHADAKLSPDEISGICALAASRAALSSPGGSGRPSP